MTLPGMISLHGLHVDIALELNNSFWGFSSFLLEADLPERVSKLKRFIVKESFYC